MATQTMVVRGWALQPLRADPEFWRRGLKVAASPKIDLARWGLTDLFR